MPLESLSCTECGSTDVQEVKPSTYVCRHCLTVFKYIDPSQISATNIAQFCSCGGAVQVRCQVCRTTTMCSSCDAVAASARHGAQLFIPTVGFGYRVKWESDGKEAAPQWTYRDGRLMHLPLALDPLTAGGYVDHGPFIGVGKVLRVLTSIHGSLEHVCWRCIAAAVPVTVDGIASGSCCELPNCAERTNGRCDCCQRALCDHHIQHSHALVTLKYEHVGIDESFFFKEIQKQGRRHPGFDPWAPNDFHVEAVGA
jgi:hypothetical protein